jgi:hypothetical protein
LHAFAQASIALNVSDWFYVKVHFGAFLAILVLYLKQQEGQDSAKRN